MMIRGFYGGPVMTGAVLSILCNCSYPDKIEIASGVPCTYEGHLKTNKNWYGFVANVSVVNTARMVFEFVFPATACCQSVLFYTEDQTNIINSRMNCWQKKNLLRPEEDQLLHLTPRFVWSGCQLTNFAGSSYYICEGGRSLIVDQMNGKQAWFVAVSNCESLYGLNLYYRILIYGQIGECKPDKFVGQQRSQIISSVPVARPIYEEAPPGKSCIKRGELNTTENWYGYIANISIIGGASFEFEFSFPHKLQKQNVILYDEEDVTEIKDEYDCWQKEGVIRSRLTHEKMIDLSLYASWNGCLLKNISNDKLDYIICKGIRRYIKQHHFFLAVSNCHSTDGLFLNYEIRIFGFMGDTCHASHTDKEPLITILTLIFISLVSRMIAFENAFT